MSLTSMFISTVLIRNLQKFEGFWALVLVKLANFRQLVFHINNEKYPLGGAMGS